MMKFIAPILFVLACIFSVDCDAQTLIAQEVVPMTVGDKLVLAEIVEEIEYPKDLMNAETAREIMEHNTETPRKIVVEYSGFVDCFTNFFVGTGYIVEVPVRYSYVDGKFLVGEKIHRKVYSDSRSSKDLFKVSILVRYIIPLLIFSVFLVIILSDKNSGRLFPRRYWSLDQFFANSNIRIALSIVTFAVFVGPAKWLVTISAPVWIFVLLTLICASLLGYLLRRQKRAGLIAMGWNILLYTVFLTGIVFFLIKVPSNYFTFVIVGSMAAWAMANLVKVFLLEVREALYFSVEDYVQKQKQKEGPIHFIEGYSMY